MSGVKGRSGRKAHLESKTITEIMRLSTATIFHALRSKELPLATRAEIATRFVLRVIPQQIEMDYKETSRTELLVKLDTISDDELKRIIDVGRHSRIEALPEVTA